MSERCRAGEQVAGAWRNRCTEHALPDRIYCTRHLGEALQRVARVRPADQPWQGIIRGSRLGQPYARIVRE
jgi:hypothetical protein